MKLIILIFFSIGLFLGALAQNEVPERKQLNIKYFKLGNHFTKAENNAKFQYNNYLVLSRNDLMGIDSIELIVDSLKIVHFELATHCNGADFLKKSESNKFTPKMKDLYKINCNDRFFVENILVQGKSGEIYKTEMIFIKLKK